MQCIILCAGFATRLYPLTKSIPKQLLPIGSRCVLDHVVDRLTQAGLNHAAIICNHRFAPDFEQWIAHRSVPISLKLIDNGVTTVDQRLGSVGDLHLALETLDIQDDFLVLHGDNFFTFALTPVLQAFKRRGHTLVTYDVATKSRARRAGQVTCNRKGEITSFVEKPDDPTSTRVSIGIYAFQPNIRHYIQAYTAAGLPTDRSGDLMAWLHRRVTLFACQIHPRDGQWFDIGTPSDYRRVRSWGSSEI